MGVVSNLVRAQAIVGTGAAIREGSIHAPSPPCLVCPCSPDTCTQPLQLPSGSCLLCTMECSVHICMHLVQTCSLASLHAIGY